MDLFYSNTYFAIGLFPIWKRAIIRSNYGRGRSIYAAIGPLYVRIGRF